MWKSIVARLGEQMSEDKHRPSMLQRLLGLNADTEALMQHQALYQQLLGIEWAIEKRRIGQIVFFAMLLFCSFFCLMFFVGGLVIEEFWATEHRSAAILGVVIVYAMLLLFAAVRLQISVAESKNSFATLGTEITADVNLVKSLL